MKKLLVQCIKQLLHQFLKKNGKNYTSFLFQLPIFKKKWQKLYIFSLPIANFFPDRDCTKIHL